MILQGHMDLIKVFTSIFFKKVHDMNWGVLGDDPDAMVILFGFVRLLSKRS